MVSPTPVPEPAKGAATSEFWLGVLAQGIVWFQAIDPSFRATPGEQTKLALAATALSVLSTLYYMRSRKDVKTAHQAAVAAAITAAATEPTSLPLLPAFSGGDLPMSSPYSTTVEKESPKTLVPVETHRPRRRTTKRPVRKPTARRR